MTLAAAMACAAPVALIILSIYVDMSARSVYRSETSTESVPRTFMTYDRAAHENALTELDFEAQIKASVLRNIHSQSDAERVDLSKDITQH